MFIDSLSMNGFGVSVSGARRRQPNHVEGEPQPHLTYRVLERRVEIGEPAHVPQKERRPDLADPQRLPRTHVLRQAAWPRPAPPRWGEKIAGKRRSAWTAVYEVLGRYPR